ncbi:hypothetical protein EG344_00070 [Chryseobacterium sp. G0162]|uniref:hypothetical protein n=1 Tax=Chryseobacterium sp. G0162 TaxID=2487063 RepID=UPI000F4FB917|nr:hypothetical protein [Chryseobacterium sp. G0162]AZB07346.1 hypothetical protein EG344_00070 [Chryseobacterium sp. G0162]
MKNNALTSGKKIAVTLFLMTAIVSNAQIPVHPLEPQPGMERPKPEALKEITTVKGTVSKMAVNDDFIYDGFYLTGN